MSTTMPNLKVPMASFIYQVTLLVSTLPSPATPSSKTTNGPMVFASGFEYVQARGRQEPIVNVGIPSAAHSGDTLAPGALSPGLAPLALASPCTRGRTFGNHPARRVEASACAVVL